MKEFNSADEILDFAVAGEIEASKFYPDLADRINSGAMKKIFKDLAATELIQETNNVGSDATPSPVGIAAT